MSGNPTRSTNGSAPPEKVFEVAAQSVAKGASLASVARWFDLSETELQAWITERFVEAPSSIAEPRAAEPEPVEVEAAATSDHPPGKPAAPRYRPSAARPTPPVHFSNGAIATIRPSSPHSVRGFKDYLHVLRRRVLIVVAALLLGASAGWFTAPGETAKATTFTATHTSIYEPKSGQPYNIEQVALLATSGDVPSRVAVRLNMNRGQVRSAVSAVAASDVGTISISARSARAATAESLAEITAEELGAEIDGNSGPAYQAELTRLTAEVQAAEKRLATVPAKDSSGQAAARANVDAANRALDQFKATPPPKSQLRTLEKANAVPVVAAGVRAPNSKPIRAGLLGGLGIALGVAGALALERADTRIRSKSTAEAAFGAPVIAEVPPIPKSSREKLLTVAQPTSPVVEAYRGLRTYVALWAPESGEDDGHRVIVVTSPAPGEGKTTTVAHLAAMLAEIGRSVVVVSADLRRPRLHQYFGRSQTPGLTDRLKTVSGPPTFEDLDEPTSVRGVRLVASGPATENPAAMIEHAGHLVGSLRDLADFVLIDSPPLLVANDGVELARHADGVLLVARAGKTPLEAAEHSAELLERLDLPVVGTVLVASEAASSASRYYSSRYYTEPDRSHWRRRGNTANGTATEGSQMAEQAADERAVEG